MPTGAQTVPTDERHAPCAQTVPAVANHASTVSTP